jgi:hypothetical protein
MTQLHITEEFKLQQSLYEMMSLKSHSTTEDGTNTFPRNCRQLSPNDTVPYHTCFAAKA